MISRLTGFAEGDKTESINRIVYKSSGTAALLAFIGAIFGLPGIGHIYVGRIGRGLLILVSGFILYIFSWISVILGSLGGLFGSVASRTPNGGLPIFQTGVGLGVFLWCAYIALLVWQIFNARFLAKKLNEQVQLTGKEPW
jgi:TM2 domain-containing membrane protein YozV